MRRWGYGFLNLHIRLCQLIPRYLIICQKILHLWFWVCVCRHIYDTMNILTMKLFGNDILYELCALQCWKYDKNTSLIIGSIMKHVLCN